MNQDAGVSLFVAVTIFLAFGLGWWTGWQQRDDRQ